MDADSRFTVVSEEFVALMGPATADRLGQPWHDIAAALDLDADGLIANALATRETWNGLSVSWPVDGSDERITVELSGLPLFDHERAFRGYRGFGVCRDIGPHGALAHHGPAVDSTAATIIERLPREELAFENALGPTPDESRTPSLSPGERRAFDELSRRLASHINGIEDEIATSASPHSALVASIAADADASGGTSDPQDAERASSIQCDLIGKLNNEIRTSLNTIIGLAEVMMRERFSAIGSERYRQYVNDIHAAGTYLMSFVNDQLVLSKIEAGKLELTFAPVSINDLTHECVAMMQQQANGARIIIRTGLSPKLPHVNADAGSLRQIVLNLLANSIKYTLTGGQVIVSTAVSEAGAVVLRVRDSGIGMNEHDIATALEPSCRVTTAMHAGSGGSGLCLSLTKALAEANHAMFHIKSAPNAGTLVEVIFPPARVLVMHG